MNNDKTRRFLIPILLLVIVSIITISSINTYLNVSMFKQHMQGEIEKDKNKYLKKHKDLIYKKVHLVDSLITFQITTIKNKLKKSLTERIKTSLEIASYVYESHKDRLTKDELKIKAALYLNAIRFNDNRGYYFTYDSNTNIIFGHALKKFIGKDMTNFKDAKGLNMASAYKESLEKEKISFTKIYFNKPLDTSKEYPKLVCVTKFEPLDLIIGTGEYLDVIEKQIQNYVLKRFENIKSDKNNYLFILNLHDINGGDNFATMILNSNRPDLIGKYISNSYKDVKDKEFRKEFLEGLRKNGESYTKYWYKNPNSNNPQPKMSYFYLQKDWNWVIASGFYYDDLEINIKNMEDALTKYTKKTIVDSLIWVVILSIIVIIIAIYVSFKIDKTIMRYTDSLLEQEKLIYQQTKMVSMGEMIGNIAHQWRQPLSVISTGATGLQIQKEHGLLSDEQFNETCEAINKNAQYLSHTIDDFKNFIKGERELSLFNLKENIESFISLVNGTIKKNDINLILNIDESININGYKNELIQCFINIFNNSKDVLNEKEIEEKFIFISTSKTKDSIIITIKDNGGGIPDNIISKVFDPYFTTKHKSQGTGLGLNMSYKLIVDGMKGSIEVSNKEYNYNDIKYKGAQFTITLPI